MMDKLKQKIDILMDEQIDKLEAYMQEILRLNENINLTAITDKEEFVEKHYVDSLAVCGLGIVESAMKIIDVGTGGGFPGVPLAVAYPEKEFYLMDSLNKRLKIIDELVAQLNIDNVKTLHGRAEDVGQNVEYREKFDVCVSRAVASLPILLEYCLPLVKVGGYFIAYKGVNAQIEIDEAKKALKILGGEVVDVMKGGSENDEHQLIIVNKIANTPSKYPRKPSMPRKKPII